MADIRIVTSSKYTAEMDAAFKAGLKSAGYGTATVEAVELDGKYDDKDGSGVSDLYDAMQKADVDSVKVIVSAGGLVSAHAANKMVKKKPFLVIIGQEPRFDLDNERFCGGVNLGMVSQNIARHNHLVNHYSPNVAPDKVCLIWNKNSKMGKEEQKDWKRHKWPDEPVTNNTNADIDTAIANAAKHSDAAIISGDPYFAAYRDWVVAAANKTFMKLCYPFSLYALSNPTKKSSMIYGPDLEAAYELTGTKAAMVLDTLANPLDTGIDPCPTVGPVWIGEP